jgi:hypothetical protein
VDEEEDLEEVEDHPVAAAEVASAGTTTRIMCSLSRFLDRVDEPCADYCLSSLSVLNP